MKPMILLAVGACALALAGCNGERRGYGGGYGYERSTIVVGEDYRGRRDDVRARRAWEARRDADRRAQRIDDRRDDARDRRRAQRERQEDRRERRNDWR